MPTLPARYWINAPSTQQPSRRYHGMLGLAVHDHGNTARFYPAVGDTISMQVPWSDLSPGWPDHLRIDKQPSMVRLYQSNKENAHGQ